MVSNFLRAGLALAVGAVAVSATSALVVRADRLPDFSGKWTIDTAKSVRLAKESGGNAFNAVLGDECTILQAADAITFQIQSGGLKVEAIYRLDGKPSENTSPGPRGTVPIVSTTRWVNDALHITTDSESEVNGAKVPVKSVRRLWLTSDGDLAVERRGNPTTVVPNAWNVYTRLK